MWLKDKGGAPCAPLVWPAWLSEQSPDCPEHRARRQQRALALQIVDDPGGAPMTARMAGVEAGAVQAPSGSTRVTWPILRPGRASRLAVEVEMRAGLGQERRASRSTSSPIRFCISTRPRRAGRARAASRRRRGHAARTARSAAPSMVQWPELWTRGAISLTTRRSRSPSRPGTSRRRARRHSRAHRRCAARWRCASRSVSRRHARRDAGRRRGCGRGARWRTGRRRRSRPSRRAGGHDRDLALEGHEALEDGRRPARAPSQAARRDRRRRDHHLALAVIAEAAGLQHARAGRSAATASRAGRASSTRPRKARRGCRDPRRRSFRRAGPA